MTHWLSRAALGLTLVLVGCLDRGATVCANGSVCPADKVCVASGCALPEQLTACENLADAAPCSFVGTVGMCRDGVCTGDSCGNGRVDDGEACDDGNLESGDGCRADCGKLEQCGDAVLDDGEACDDGNQNAADGCDACIRTEWVASTLIGGGRLATGITFERLTGIAIDLHGNRYVADTSGYRVYRIDATGTITVIAGTGTPGYSGDGGAGTSAQLDSPEGLAVDGIGNVYIVDRTNNAIRRVDPFGTITTVAGGTAGSGGDGGPATLAQFSNPIDIAVDGLGQLFIADEVNNRIRKVDTSGIITTIAGSTIGFAGDGGLATSAKLDHPDSITLDHAGNLYITDSNNYRIRRIDTAGIITTIAGNGTSTFSPDGTVAAAGALSADDVEVDGAGNIYLTERYRVRRIDTTGHLSTLAGTGVSSATGDGGPAAAATLSGPDRLVRVGDGTIHVTDTDRIRTLDTSGIITSTAGTGFPELAGDGGAATAAAIEFFDRVSADAAGNVYVIGALRDIVKRIGPDGLMTTFAGTGVSGFSGDGGPATSAELDDPAAAASDAQGRIYIADTLNNRVRRVDTAGIITTIAGTGVAGFSGDGGPAVSAQLSAPSGVAVDAAGNVYIADRSNLRIRRIDASGIITTFAGTGGTAQSGDGGPATSAAIGNAEMIAVSAQGTVYFADINAHRVRAVTAGIITTVAGTGTAGFSGDGGQAVLAQLNGVYGLAVDAIGNLYIADRNNERIRQVSPTGIITTFSGTGVSDFTGDGGPVSLLTHKNVSGVAVDNQGGVIVCNDPVMLRIRGGVVRSIGGQIDPPGTGPQATGQLADPRGLVVTPTFTLFAGGSSGTVQATRPARDWLEVVAGRHPQRVPTGNLARYRDATFGTVGGVAYDAASNLIFISETSAHRLYAITPVDPADARTWTIAPLANTAGIAGFANGAAATARFRAPTGLYFDETSHRLYVADTGNHVIRAIDLAGGIATATVTTVVGTPATLGYAGDGGAGSAALLYSPTAITRCGNGDLFIADTGNNRVRRIANATSVISTVLGDGIATSAGEGVPASSFPVRAPSGLACDATGNLFVTSTTTIRALPADAAGVVDGTGAVDTVYGKPPRDMFPSSVTACLTGIAAVGATLQVTDACTGILVEIQRQPL